MKKLVVALAITIVATFAIAQEHNRRMIIHGLGADSAACAASLGLSADQQTQWDAIHQQLEASVKPLFGQISAAEQQLNALADSSSADATAVGRQYLALRALQLQVKAAHESAKQKIDAILTPDQKAKLDSMHFEGMEHGPMMRMIHPEPGSKD